MMRQSSILAVCVISFFIVVSAPKPAAAIELTLWQFIALVCIGGAFSGGVSIGYQREHYIERHM